MLKALVAASLAFLSASESNATAATINLDCSYEPVGEGEEKSASNVPEQFSAQIHFTGDQATKVTVGKGNQCDARLAFVTEMEIGFACGIDLAGQRISYTFTLNRLTSAFEQRFFFAGKLKLIHFGRCKHVLW
jgi:hypothetical protein